MKIKSISILGTVLIGLVVAFSACEEKDDYNYNGIDPIIGSISGPAAVRGGIFQVYRATARGGSSYTFTAKTGNAIEGFALVDGQPFARTVDFKESLTETFIDTIVVVETTAGGKVSPAKELRVVASPLSVAVTGDADAVILQGVTVTKTYTVNFQYPNATYEWSIAGSDAVIASGAGTASITVDFTFPDEPAVINTISVVVTTRRGNVLNASKAVSVQQFCPLANGLADLVGSWSGIDALTIYTTGASQVVTTLVDNKLMITGLGYEWMMDFWGEVIVAGGTVELVLNADGTVVIANQYYMSTTYNGAAQDDYTIAGTGRMDNCGDYPTLDIVYEMNNYGDDWGAWCYANGYSSTPHFEAHITLDPALKSGIERIINSKKINKPTR
jgi:hypothetical protein